MNGDSSMQTKAVAECGFTNNNKDVGSYISGQVNGQMRVNYVLFLGKQFSISRIDYGNVTTGQVDAHTRISTTVEFEEPYSEAPVVFIQDVSPGGDVSNAINNKTIVFSVSTTGFTASSFNNTGSNFDSMKFFWLAIGK